MSADSVVATLLDRRFITESGRKDVAGRPMLYKTTPEFMEAFGLRSLEELPPVDVDSGAPLELALPIPTALAPASDPRDAERDAESPPDGEAAPDAEQAVIINEELNEEEKEPSPV